jgi:phage baseplate assembly protein W
MTSALDGVAGPSFPLRIDASGGIAFTTGIAKVQEDIRVLLGTRVLERPLAREYGTRLRSFVQLPDDDVLADLARGEVQQAIVRFEPRVVVTKADVERHDDQGEQTWVRVEYMHVHEPVLGSAEIPLT